MKAVTLTEGKAHQKKGEFPGLRVDGREHLEAQTAQRTYELWQPARTRTRRGHR